jgi:hypothetical protein
LVRPGRPRRQQPVEKAKSGIVSKTSQLSGHSNYEVRLWDLLAEVFVEFMAVTSMTA